MYKTTYALLAINRRRRFKMNHIYRTKGNPPDPKSVSSYTTFRPINCFISVYHSGTRSLTSGHRIRGRARIFGSDSAYNKARWWIAQYSVADPECLPRILIFTHPGSRISDPESRIQKQQQKRGMKKNLLSYPFM
jgi:hypothetical protein